MLFLITTVNSVWNQVHGPFFDFLDSDGNTAKDYLCDGVHWYQMKIRLHGTEYFVPLSVTSELKYNEIRGKFKLVWTLTLPLNDVKTERNKERLSDNELNTIYGEPQSVRLSARRCMSIIKAGEQYMAIIDSVNSNRYHSGTEIMAIFMTIAVKKNINFGLISLTDTSTKYCSNAMTKPCMKMFEFPDRVPQSIFMAFLGRLDFYRDWGFYAIRQTEFGYRGDRKKQAEFDAATRKLRNLRISEVIRAAVDDAVTDQAAVKTLVEALVAIDDPKESVTMSAYLKQFSDQWDNECHKYLRAIAGLESIPTIRINYLSRMKIRSTSLIWMKSEMTAVDKRMESVQN